jgi:asparagine synthase (glutamine-hydrolysing)
MCGIFGWITSRPVPDRGTVLTRALSELAHRGPDGEGAGFYTTVDGHEVALGHRRLSIIDLEGGAQPLVSHDGRYVITFNGEIYNYIELRQELRELGHSFETASDTEVILEAYRAWGPDCVRRFRGMFALVIYDIRDETVFVARDQFGKKPLFLSDLPGGFVFSSEIAPLLRFPGVRTTLNQAVIGEYLACRYVAGPATFFEGVRKLRPGCYLVWKAGAAREERYFTPPFATVRPTDISLPDAAEALRQVLDDSVRLRMRSDAPFGAYLSGGLDSSVIVSLMTRHSAGPVSTFSVGFNDSELSELDYARRVAARLGTRHEEFVVTPEDFACSWEAAVRYRGAPVSEASDIPILLLSQRARASVKMVLTGEGADELLAGYPKYIAEKYVAAYQRVIPAGLHRAVLDPAVRALPYGFRRLKILSRALGQSDIAARERTWFASGSMDQVEALLGHELPEARPDDNADVLISSTRRLQLFDQRTWLPDNLLERGDRMMMGGSIEGRMPFMDVELAALVATFPDAYLTRGQGKHVLREIAKPLVDPETINRKKLGFKVPIGDWFRTDQRELLSDLLVSDHSRTRRILNWGAIDTLFNEHMAGRQNNERMLWTLANLELFLRVYGIDF